MSWEKRGAKLYYYRKERGPDGRVRSIYFGNGERARAASLEDNVPVPISVAQSEPMLLTPVAQEEQWRAELEKEWATFTTPRRASSDVYRRLGHNSVDSSRRYRS